LATADSFHVHSHLFNLAVADNFIATTWFEVGKRHAKGRWVNVFTNADAVSNFACNQITISD